MSTLLTRDNFREGVFKRDGYKCVFCDRPAVDAHHIIERRLFQEPHELGGYFLNNGASVCEEHHILCEKTLISVEEVRERCGILKKVFPSHLYDDQIYDKWGNIILPNGQRLRGELFYDESVQKILKEVLGQFTSHVKYPRTSHLPFSPGMNDDDRMHASVAQWEGKEIVLTVKLDGENTTCYSDHIHARSLDSRNHPSRNWVKNFWSSISHEIPEGWRICGENVYAKHSIYYDDLKSYFYGFSMWNDKNFCLSWDETIEWFDLIGIVSVPVLYRGIFDEKLIRKIGEELDYSTQEGFVLRTCDGFSYGEFRKYVGKFVRPGHVMTTQHWMHGQAVVPNKLHRFKTP